MFIAALSGYVGSATSGYPVKFFGWVLPSWAGAHDAVKDACSVVHLVSNWVLVAAIGAHVAATIYHQWGVARRPALADVADRRAGAQARRRSARRGLMSPVASRSR